MLNRKQLMQLLTIGAVLISPSLAQAHAHLHSSDPAKDSTLSKFPSEIVLHFTEALEAPLCKIELKNIQSGEALAVSKPSSLSDDPKSLRASVTEQNLKEGIYKLNWKVVSKDGHKMQGDYQFTLKGIAAKK